MLGLLERFGEDWVMGCITSKKPLLCSMEYNRLFLVAINRDNRLMKLIREGTID